MSRLAVRIDRAACSGAGACLRRAPHTFSLDVEHKAVALDPPGDPEARLIEAVRCCPNFAIALSRDGQPLP